jgi:hypothetical protein
MIPVSRIASLTGAVIALAAIVTVALIVQVVGLAEFTHQQREVAIARGEDCTERILLGLELAMNVVEERAAAVAAELERGPVDRETLLGRMREFSESEPYLLGMTVAFTPFAIDPARRLDAPFFDRSMGRFRQIEDSYDYTNPERAEDARWYQEPLRRGAPMWVTGFGQASQEPYVGYSVPIHAVDADQVDRRPLGVVRLAVSLHELNDLFNRNYVGRLGGGALVDGDGRLLAFPIFDHVREARKYAEVIAESGNRDLAVVEGLMRRGKSGVRRCRDSSVFPGEQPGWVFYRQVPETGWSMAVAIFEAELANGHTEWRRRFIGILLNVVALLALGLTWFLKVDRLETTRLWVGSTAASVVLVLTIGLIWAVSDRYGDPPHRVSESSSTVRIDDVESLDEFLKGYRERMSERHRVDVLIVPTWLFVRSIVFEDSHSLRVSGTIVQRYPDTAGADLTRGVVLPNLDPDAESFQLVERYRRRLQGEELITYAFRATLRGSFDYRAYPFDRQLFQIQLAHPEFDRNVVLAPDLKRYPYLQTAAGPGLHRPMEVPGWSVEGSGFSYAITTYNVEWSPDDDTSIAKVPVLQYDVRLHRKFPTPFISHIVPILIVAVLLHGVLISSSFSERRRSTSGFSAFGVLETCGAFFFAIALMHIDLRRGLDLDVITYMEMIYLIAYFILLLVVLDALVFTTSNTVAWIEYQDNLIAKLLFWPMFLGLVLGATLWTFY